jgi:hypothetical protein
MGNFGWTTPREDLQGIVSARLWEGGHFVIC